MVHPFQPVELMSRTPSLSESNRAFLDFRLAEDFVHRSLKVAREGVAVLVRTVFLESVERYENLFRDQPPTKVAQFTERVAMVEGRLTLA